jgi:hypothetical protein
LLFCRRLQHFCHGELAIRHTNAKMTGERTSAVRVVLVACWLITTAFGAFAAASAAAQVTLEVGTSHGLPELHHSELSRFIAAHMAQAGLADWRFGPATGDGVAADRVEWSFKLNPYAGGEVRSFVHSLSYDERFVGRRPITIEARLYLNGEYQTLVEQQAIIRGGPNDPDLAAAVVSATRSLLGPKGAYRAIEMGQHRARGEK